MVSVFLGFSAKSVVQTAQPAHFSEHRRFGPGAQGSPPLAVAPVSGAAGALDRRRWVERFNCGWKTHQEVRILFFLLAATRFCVLDSFALLSLYSQFAFVFGMIWWSMKIFPNRIRGCHTLWIPNLDSSFTRRYLRRRATRRCWSCVWGTLISGSTLEDLEELPF